MFEFCCPNREGSRTDSKLQNGFLFNVATIVFIFWFFFSFFFLHPTQKHEKREKKKQIKLSWSTVVPLLNRIDNFFFGLLIVSRFHTEQHSLTTLCCSIDRDAARTHAMDKHASMLHIFYSCDSLSFISWQNTAHLMILCGNNSIVNTHSHYVFYLFVIIFLSSSF